MAAWWVDRALPGIVGGSIVTLGVALSHYLLRREIRRAKNGEKPEGDG